MIAITHPTVGYRARDSVDSIRYKITDGLPERIAAYQLVYQNYLHKGLIEPNEHRLRVTPYHLLRTTNTFTALQGTEPICTVTLIGDGELGLPMESIYHEEVEQARREGLYVGEVSCLACGDLEIREFLPLFVKLTRLMAQHARAHGMDQFLIATHPKHGRFYQRFMGFEQIGEEKEYPTVRNAPAAAYCLDFARIDRERPACYDEYFGSPMSARELVPRPMTRLELDFFRPKVCGRECLVPTLA